MHLVLRLRVKRYHARDHFSRYVSMSEYEYQFYSCRIVGKHQYYNSRELMSGSYEEFVYDTNARIARNEFDGRLRLSKRYVFSRI